MRVVQPDPRWATLRRWSGGAISTESIIGLVTACALAFIATLAVVNRNQGQGQGPQPVESASATAADDRDDDATVDPGGPAAPTAAAAGEETTITRGPLVAQVDDPDPSTSSVPAPVDRPTTTEPTDATTDRSSSPTSADGSSTTVTGSTVTLVTTGATTGSSGTGPTVTPPPPTGDPGQPTQAALDADRQTRAVPAGYRDCGTVVLSSGWPTTTAPQPGAALCIVEAAQSGEASQYSYTGRNQANGMSGAIFRVDQDGAARRITYTADRDGQVVSTRTSCGGFGPPGSPVWEPICLAA